MTEAQAKKVYDLFNNGHEVSIPSPYVDSFATLWEDFGGNLLQ